MRLKVQIARRPRCQQLLKSCRPPRPIPIRADLAKKHPGALDSGGEIPLPRSFPSGAHVAEVEIDPETWWLPRHFSREFTVS